MADTEMFEYVVLADAVNVTTGWNPHKGEPIVQRLERTSVITAAPDHPSIVDLLSMGGICRKQDLKEKMAELRDAGSLRRPTMQRMEDKSFRITAAGTALSLAGPGDVPEAALDDVVPTHAPMPDLSTVEA